MKDFAAGFIYTLFILSWLVGTVFAVGWWKMAAALFPPYAWYLVAERILEKLGWTN